MENHLFEDAIQLIKEDNKPAAREILVGLIDENPYDELAWWWFAQAHYTKKQQAVILRKGLAANPDSELLANTIKKLDTQGTRVYEKPKSPPIPTPAHAVNLPSDQVRPKRSSLPIASLDETGDREEKNSKPLMISIPDSITSESNLSASKEKDPEFFSNLKFHDPYAESRKPAASPAPQPSAPIQPASGNNQLPLYIMGGLTALVLVFQLVFFFTSLLTDKGPNTKGAADQDTAAAQQVIGLQESFETNETTAPTATTEAAPIQPDPDIINASAGDSTTQSESTTASQAEATEPPAQVAPTLPLGNGEDAAPSAPSSSQPEEPPETTSSTTPDAETTTAPEMTTIPENSLAGKIQSLEISGTALKLPRALYFLSSMNGQPQIYVMDAYGQDLVQITDEPAGVSDFDVAPTTGAIVYVTGNRLMLIQNNFREKEILVEGAPAPNPMTNQFIWTEKISDPVWSDNGRYIAFGQNGINILHLSTRDIQTAITNAPPPKGETSPFRFYIPLGFAGDTNDPLIRVVHEEGVVLATYKTDSQQLVFVNLNACCDFTYGIDNIHIYMADDVDANHNPGLWQINPAMGSFKALTFDNESGIYAWPKQSPFGRLFYFYTEPGKATYGLYSSQPMALENKTLIGEKEVQVGEALWSEDAYLVVVQDTADQSIKILKTDGSPTSILPFNGSHFIWSKTKDIDLSFFEDKPPSTTKIEINIEEPIKTEDITINEPKMSMVTDLNPDALLFEEYQGQVFPPYPEELQLASFTQVSDQFNISVLYGDELIMVWLGEYLNRYDNGQKLSILRDLVAVPENLDKAGFSLGKCTLDGLVDPNVFAIGSWQGSFQLGHIEYALWIDTENKQLFPIYRDNISCVMDLLIQQKNGGFNIWNNSK